LNLPPFEVQVEVLQEDDVHAFRLSGELDQASAPELREPLIEAIDSGAKRVLIDLSDCGFIDSTGLSVLVRAQQQLHAEEGNSRRLAICCPDEDVRRLLEITGLDRAMELHDSREDAMAALTGLSG
jgi:anti-sigma B factor antagonist